MNLPFYKYCFRSWWRFHEYLGIIQGESGTDKDSDAEFEQMLAEAEEVKEEEASIQVPQPPVRKAKTKIGGKNKKKKKKTKTTNRWGGGEGDEAGYEVSVNGLTSHPFRTLAICSCHFLLFF